MQSKAKAVVGEAIKRMPAKKWIECCTRAVEPPAKRPAKQPARRKAAKR